MALQIKTQASILDLMLLSVLGAHLSTFLAQGPTGADTTQGSLDKVDGDVPDTTQKPPLPRPEDCVDLFNDLAEDQVEFLFPLVTSIVEQLFGTLSQFVEADFERKLPKNEDGTAEQKPNDGGATGPPKEDDTTGYASFISIEQTTSTYPDTSVCTAGDDACLETAIATWATSKKTELEEFIKTEKNTIDVRGNCSRCYLIDDFASTKTCRSDSGVTYCDCWLDFWSAYGFFDNAEYAKCM